ncbi:cellulose binding domain-containing protein [Micromonospora sp. NPDC048999]|uniref:cellulose binding domain-containing protein n=1 Tax=Micromonospora sp. NPDC048999 TaxID=3155391 RepID=UPI0033D85448
MRTQWLARRIATVAGVVVALGMGVPAVAAIGMGAPAVAADPTPTTSSSPTRGPCDAAAVTGSVIDQTATSITFALRVSLMCGFQDATVSVYTSADDAQHWRNPRGSATAHTLAETEALTVAQLDPDTAYWYRFRGGGSPWQLDAMGPTYTLPDAGCTATLSTEQWPGGFVTNVTVKAGTKPLNGWAVTLTLPSGASIINVWSATNSSTSGNVTFRNLGYNRTIAAGRSTEFGFLGNGNAPTGTPTCSAS